METTSILEAITVRVPRNDETYRCDAGVLNCIHCHTAREAVVNFPGVGRRVVPCLCRCMADAWEQERQRLRNQEQQDRLRRLCSAGFQDRSLENATFDRDDRKNPSISNALLRYTAHFDELRKNGTGLLLYGPVGTGKTYYAACIANALMAKGYGVLMTSFPRLINQIGGAEWAQRQGKIYRLTDHAMVVLDDLAAERLTDYTVEQMTAILDTLYRAGVPLVITTNHNPGQLTGHQDLRVRRIWDRIMERCHPIAVLGESRRRELGQEAFRQTRELLGL